MLVLLDIFYSRDLHALERGALQAKMFLPILLLFNGVSDLFRLLAKVVIPNDQSTSDFGNNSIKWPLKYIVCMLLLHLKILVLRLHSTEIELTHHLETREDSKSIHSIIFIFCKGDRASFE